MCTRMCLLLSFPDHPRVCVYVQASPYAGGNGRSRRVKPLPTLLNEPIAVMMCMCVCVCVCVFCVCVCIVVSIDCILTLVSARSRLMRDLNNIRVTRGTARCGAVRAGAPGERR